jgi:glycosyltransferase involved in cell wall biosynthesis
MASKCLYLPNYVDLGAFPAPAPGRLRLRYRARKLLFLRRLEPPRGARFFVEVCKLLRDEGLEYTAELCGWGNERQMVESMIKEQRLESHVRLSESRLEDAAAVADTASISVIPSQWSEGTSLSAVESIAQGIPIIASDVGGLPNIVIPGFNGYICPCSTHHFAVHIRRLLHNEDEYLRLAHNCLTLRDAFSFDRWITSLMRHLVDRGIIPNSAG